MVGSLLAFGGAFLIALGLTLIWVPLGVIAAGIFMLYMAWEVRE